MSGVYWYKRKYWTAKSLFKFTCGYTIDTSIVVIHRSPSWAPVIHDTNQVYPVVLSPYGWVSNYMQVCRVIIILFNLKVLMRQSWWLGIIYWWIIVNQWCTYQVEYYIFLLCHEIVLVCTLPPCIMPLRQAQFVL